MERGDWKGAADLAVHPSKFAYADAMTHFARALGAARSGNPAAAKADIAKLVELREKLREAKDAYWTEQVDIQWQIADAWVLYAEGKYDDALKAMSAAADAEDKTEKHPVTPGVPTPARELYGQMLLDRGWRRRRSRPSRRRSRRSRTASAPRLAPQRRRKKPATPPRRGQHYMDAVALTENADPVRPQIAEARAFLAKK